MDACLPSSDAKFGGDIFEISRVVSQDAREAALRAALDGSAKVLVSTDKMARGIDLPNVSLVLNYDAPKHSTTYIHRVGRTARANRRGDAVTFIKSGQVCVVYVVHLSQLVICFELLLQLVAKFPSHANRSGFTAN